MANVKKAAVGKKPPQLSAEEILAQRYAQACAMENWIQYAVSFQDRSAFCQQAAEAFQALGDYEDCPERMQRCLSMGEHAATAERDEAFSALKEEISGCKTAKDYYYALEKLERFSELPDAVELIKEFRRKRTHLLRRRKLLRWGIALALCLVAAIAAVMVKTTAFQYLLGSFFYAQKDYNHALTWYNQSRDYADSRDRIRVCRYQRGLTFQEQGKLQAAYQKFRETRGYLDSDERAVACFTALLAKTKPGKVVKLGKDGSSFSQWIVLENDGSHVTLLAEFSEARVFDPDGKAWTESELYQWLNGDFLKSHFVDYEQERMVNPTGEGDGPVYLLSAEEVGQYAAILQGTDGGDPLDTFKLPKYGYWLRTPASNEGGQMIVQATGDTDPYGCSRTQNLPHVRPVITLSSAS